AARSSIIRTATTTGCGMSLPSPSASQRRMVRSLTGGRRLAWLGSLRASAIWRAEKPSLRRASLSSAGVILASLSIEALRLGEAVEPASVGGLQGAAQHHGRHALGPLPADHLSQLVALALYLGSLLAHLALTLLSRSILSRNPLGLNGLRAGLLDQMHHNDGRLAPTLRGDLPPFADDPQIALANAALISPRYHKALHRAAVAIHCACGPAIHRNGIESGAVDRKSTRLNS